MQLLETISQTALIQWVAASDWGYPIVLTGHALGMALVVGILLIFDLRVLGFAKRLPLPAFEPLFRVAWLGFAINVVSGSLLFCVNYAVFIRNTAFLTKISLLSLGALINWWLVREIDAGKNGDAVAQRARVLAAIGLVLWLGAITAGRIVGYTSVPE